MTADAPPQAPPAVIRFGIGYRALLPLLHLGSDVQVIGASVEDGGATVTFYLEHPGAPAGADTMSPVYECDREAPFGMRMTAGVEWFRRGVRIGP